MYVVLMVWTCLQIKISENLLSGAAGDRHSTDGRTPHRTLGQQLHAAKNDEIVLYRSALLDTHNMKSMQIG